MADWEIKRCTSNPAGMLRCSGQDWAVKRCVTSTPTCGSCATVPNVINLVVSGTFARPCSLSETTSAIGDINGNVSLARVNLGGPHCDWQSDNFGTITINSYERSPCVNQLSQAFYSFYYRVRLFVGGNYQAWVNIFNVDLPYPGVTVWATDVVACGSCVPNCIASETQDVWDLYGGGTAQITP